MDLHPSGGQRKRVGQAIMVRRNSGTVVIDGRAAMSQENDFPLFDRNDHYILFLAKARDENLYFVVGGPQGAFSLRDGVKQLSLELGDWSNRHGAVARAAFLDREVELDQHARTVDMLREGRWSDPVFLIGADEFADFPLWKEPDAVLELARLGVAGRPGYPRERLDQVLASLARPERVLFFEIEPVPVSSSEIRERVARGEPIDGLVPAAVAAEIAGRGLYRG